MPKRSGAASSDGPPASTTSPHANPKTTATGHSSLELVVEGLWEQRAELWGRLQQHFHTNELAAQTIRDHAAIAEAIAARNPDAARVAMHRHLARVAREFQRGVDDRPQPPRNRRAPPAAPVRVRSRKAARP